jgi:PGF-pre-PGF domain-containing protein
VTSSGSQDTTSPGGGGGSSGGGSTSSTRVTVKRGNANITVPSIAAGKMATVSIVKTEDVAFRQINISVVNSVNNIKLVITKLPNLPAIVTQDISGKVYHYINIDKENITDTSVNKIYIKFAVNKTWLTANQVANSDIVLYRWSDNKWNELATTYLKEDSSEVFYKAESPGLSVFIIGTKGITPTAPTASAVTCVESWQCTPWSACTGTHTRTCTDSNNCGTTTNKPAESEACTVEKAEVEKSVSINWAIVAIGAIIIVSIVSVFVFRNEIKSKLSKKKTNKE